MEDYHVETDMSNKTEALSQYPHGLPDHPDVRANHRRIMQYNKNVRAWERYRIGDYQAERGRGLPRHYSFDRKSTLH